MTPILHNIQQVADRLSVARFNLASERDLQDGIEIVLKDRGWKYEREARLDARSRIDFLLPDVGLGIEVKIAKNLALLTRQLHRYAQCQAIHGLLLVTTRMRLVNLTPSFNGKPARSVCLFGSTL